MQLLSEIIRSSTLTRGEAIKAMEDNTLVAIEAGPSIKFGYVEAVHKHGYSVRNKDGKLLTDSGISSHLYEAFPNTPSPTCPALTRKALLAYPTTPDTVKLLPYLYDSPSSFFFHERGRVSIPSYMHDDVHQEDAVNADGTSLTRACIDIYIDPSEPSPKVIVRRGDTIVPKTIACFLTPTLHTVTQVVDLFLAEFCPLTPMRFAGTLQQAADYYMSECSLQPYHAPLHILDTVTAEMAGYAEAPSTYSTITALQVTTLIGDMLIQAQQPPTTPL